MVPTQKSLPDSMPNYDLNKGITVMSWPICRFNLCGTVRRSNPGLPTF